MTETRVLHWDELPGQESTGVIRQAFAGQGAELKRVAVPAGTLAPRHDHPHEQIILVLDGTGTLTTADGARPFRPGSIIHLPAHSWHAAEFTADTVLVEVNLPA